MEHMGSLPSGFSTLNPSRPVLVVLVIARRIATTTALRRTRRKRFLAGTKGGVAGHGDASADSG